MRPIKVCRISGAVAVLAWCVSVVVSGLDDDWMRLALAVAITATVCTALLWVTPPAVTAWRQGYRTGYLDAQTSVRRDAEPFR